MLDISLKLENSNIPVYMQIYEYIKSEILLNRIPYKTKLPSIRNLSIHLGVSKNTVNSAYQQLISEGYVKSHNRSGLFIEDINNNIIDKPIKTYSNYNIDISSQGHIKYDFSNGQIDVSSFPYSIFKKILSDSINSESSEILLYGEHQGDYSFREKIAEYIHHSRGVICNPEQIILGSGTQQSLSLLSLILKEEFSSLGFEEPGYNGARNVFIHNNIEIIPIPLEEDGINISSLYESNVLATYVTPSHQFPMGMVMPISKRLKLLKWAEEKDGIIIEDDYDGEFRYKGKPIPSLQGLDTNNRVIYIGTFSKSLMPSIRISYLILPLKYLNIYKDKFKIYEQSVPRILQNTIETFMEKGYWDKHIRRCRVLYKKKHEILISSLKEIMGSSISIIGEDSGLHLLIEVKTKLSLEELLKRALIFNVKVNSTKVYWYNYPNESFPVIFICFAGIKLELIYDGIKRLKEAWYL